MASKIKINGYGSQEYSGGRIDTFEISVSKLSGNHHTHLIPLFKELGFENAELDLDIEFGDFNNEEFPNHWFFYGDKKIKAFLIIAGGIVKILIDTTESRDKIVTAFEKYFIFD